MDLLILRGKRSNPPQQSPASESLTSFLGRSGVANIQGVNVTYLNGIQNLFNPGFSEKDETPYLPIHPTSHIKITQSSLEERRKDRYPLNEQLTLGTMWGNDNSEGTEEAKDGKGAQDLVKWGR